MEYRDRINLDEVIMRKNELIDIFSDDYNKFFFDETKRLGDMVPGSKVKTDNKVFRFANAYVVEGAVKLYLQLRFHYKLQYMDKEHDWIGKSEHRRNLNDPDLIDPEDGTTFEVKSGRYTLKTYDWNQNTHNASFVLFFERYEKKLYWMNHKTQTPKFVCDMDLELPFPDD